MVYSNVFSGKLGIHEVLCSVCKHHHVMAGRGQQTIWLSWAKGWKPVGNDRTFSLGWCSEVDGNLNSRRDRGGKRQGRKGENAKEGRRKGWRKWSWIVNTSDLSFLLHWATDKYLCTVHIVTFYVWNSVDTVVKGSIYWTRTCTACIMGFHGIIIEDHNNTLWHTESVPGASIQMTGEPGSDPEFIWTSPLVESVINLSWSSINQVLSQDCAGCWLNWLIFVMRNLQKPNLWEVTFI